MLPAPNLCRLLNAPDLGSGISFKRRALAAEARQLFTLPHFFFFFFCGLLQGSPFSCVEPVGIINGPYQFSPPLSLSCSPFRFFFFFTS